MREFANFSYDRKAPFGESCRQLYQTIENFAGQEILNEWFVYLEETLDIPKTVIQHRFKAYLEASFHYQKNKFQDKLRLTNIIKIAFFYLGFWRYILLKSKRTSKKIYHYDLIVEWIENETELNRFSKLISLFGKKRTLVIAVSPVEKKDYQVIYKPRYQYYNRRRILQIIWQELTKGIKLHHKVSKKLNVNFIVIAGHIINQYLYYYSIFYEHRAKYCIQERHYQTSSIKNYLFKQFGGKYSCTIQKNVHQLGANGFYYHADVLFSLGESTARRAFEYGAEIGQVVPVGSMFMEYYWFENSQYRQSIEKKWDIIFLGINVSTALYYVDAYESFKNDYYQVFKWLADFSRENPDLRIGIKHHSNNKIDEQEMEIIKGTNVKRIDQNLDSYWLAFQAKCLVTFGSTMGYELLTHSQPVIFLDPDGRCALLPDKTDVGIRPFRVFNYQEFTTKVTKILSGLALGIENFYKDDFCLPSDQVSTKIYSFLASKNSHE